MHGLIFFTWEKYLSERFGTALLHEYRASIGETPINAPLASRVYDDAVLLAGVGAACKLTGLPADMILREYGHYFIMNGLTSHLCAYLLTRVSSGRDLLLTMRNAHAQMRRTPDGLAPPLFSYEAISGRPNEFALIYDSPRKLCPVLLGAIEGAAERYGEQVQIVERTCMKQGAEVCRFEVHFLSLSGELHYSQTPERQVRSAAQQQFANLVLTALPNQNGITLMELCSILQRRPDLASSSQLRLSPLLKALRHLVYAGLVSSTANQPNDDLTHRHYWRTPTPGK